MCKRYVCTVLSIVVCTNFPNQLAIYILMMLVRNVEQFCSPGFNFKIQQAHAVFSKSNMIIFNATRNTPYHAICWKVLFLSSFTLCSPFINMSNTVTTLRVGKELLT